jgi:hypothetical protein
MQFSLANMQFSLGAEQRSVILYDTPMTPLSYPFDTQAELPVDAENPYFTPEPGYGKRRLLYDPAEISGWAQEPEFQGGAARLFSLFRPSLYLSNLVVQLGVTHFFCGRFNLSNIEVYTWDHCWWPSRFKTRTEERLLKFS